MTKEFLNIEFRYNDTPKWSKGSECAIKKIAIGIYDNLDDAIKNGNEILDELKKQGFEIRQDDFFKKVHLFGNSQRLVTNCCYSNQPAQFFAHIEKLDFADLSETIKEVFAAGERWKLYDKEQRQEDE